MSKFPVPISGEKIPHGWFANLVRFVNSLTLRGDGRYTMVSHNETGTTVTLTPAVKNAIDRTGGTPGGSGANQDLSVSVSGNTATIGLSGSTATAEFVGTGSVTLSGNTSGQIEINATGGTSSGSGFPDYFNPDVEQGNVLINQSYSFNHPVWLIGYLGVEPDSSGQYSDSYSIELTSGANNKEIVLNGIWTDTESSIWRISQPISIPIPANVSFQVKFGISSYSTPFYSLGIYPRI